MYAWVGTGVGCHSLCMCGLVHVGVVIACVCVGWYRCGLSYLVYAWVGTCGGCHSLCMRGLVQVWVVIDTCPLC